MSPDGGVAETKSEPVPAGEASEAAWTSLADILEAAKAQSIEGGHEQASDSAEAAVQQVAQSAAADHAFQELTTLALDVPVGKQLCHSVLRMCFAPGLGVDPRGWKLYQEQLADGDAGGSDEANSVWPSLLWYGGLGSPLKPATSYTLDSNRQEILRCLIALMSAELYVVPDPRSPARSPFSDSLVAADAPFAPTLFSSLMNAAVSMDPSALSIVPYSAAFTSEYPVVTATLSLQALLLLLNYAPSVEASSPAPTPDAGSHTATEAAAFATHSVPVFNRFRVMLAAVNNPLEYFLMFKGIVTLLQNTHETKATWLPHTVRELNAEQEGIILLWKCLDENRGFLHWLLTAPEADVNELVRPLCFLLWTGRKNPARVGLINISIFVLLLLSGEREFAVALNAAYDGSLPADLPAFEGSHADLLVITLHKTVVSSDPRIGTLFPCIFTILNNITPYTKGLCLVAAVKLTGLLELCADPDLLLGNPSTPTFLNKLLMAFNNIVQYQYSGNSHVVYAMVRRADIFSALARVHSLEDLRRLTVQSAPPPLAALSGPPAPTDAAAASSATAGVPASPVAAAATAPVTPSFNAPPDTSEATPAPSDQDAPVPASAAVPTSESVQPIAEPSQALDKPAEEQGPLPVVPGSIPPAAAPPAQEAQPGQEHLTEEWAAGWLQEMHSHLHAIHAMLGHLVPRVSKLLAEGDGTVDEGAVLAFVRDTTMVGLLPVPHALVMHKYTANEFTQLWFTTFLWGVVFLRNQEFPIYDTRKIKLFAIAVE